MADLAVRLSGPALLTATYAIVYTVPAATKTILRSVHVTNVNTTTSRDFGLSLGTSAAAGTLLFSFPIAPNGVFDWSGFIVLNATDALWATGSVTLQLNLTMSGIEVS